MKVLLRLMPYIKPYWLLLLVGMGLAVVVSGMEGAIAYLVKPAMDDIFLKRDLLMLTLVPVALLLVYIIKGAARYGQSYLMATVGERVIATIRFDLYSHLQKLSLSFFSDQHSGELMSRLMNDVNRLARFSSQALVMAFRQMVTVVALLAVMFIREWLLTLFAIVAFPMVGVTVRVIGRRLYKINKRAQEKTAEMNVLLQEAFTGTKIVKAFGREGHERERFDKLNQRLLALAIKDHRTDELTEPLMELLAAFGMALGLWYAGTRVIDGSMTPGTFFSFLAAVLLLYAPVRKLSRLWNSLQQTVSSAERIFELLDAPPTIVDRPGAHALTGFQDRVEFERASFRYPDGDEQVLKEISFTVKKGEVVAFVGMSGAGKSTLVDLIPRFHDVTEGQIRVDGVDVKDLSVASLRAQIGIVTQETFLFNDTIYANIAYGRLDATREEVEQAAQLAQAHQFVASTPNGYDSLVGERGVKLSGGQRQRIAIARAFLKDPPILILDEATSDLDAESEFLVHQALTNLMKGRTVFVIAHRLSTVRSADRILVIHAGRIVESGRHDELMARDGVYRRLYSYQMDPDLAPPFALP